jgi:hypothetical protein
MKKFVMNAVQKKEYTRLIATGDGMDCYHFAVMNPGVNIALLQKQVLEHGSAMSCCFFAFGIAGSDVKALQQRVIELGDGFECYRFATLPFADKAALQACVLEIGDIDACESFARAIPGADIAALNARILYLENANKT